jgi:cytochrome P450
VTPFTARITVDELEWREVTFPPGTIVLVSAWHANRDGLSDGDSFEIAAERTPSRLHTFAAGFHCCAGANLVMAEL